MDFLRSTEPVLLIGGSVQSGVAMRPISSMSTARVTWALIVRASTTFVSLRTTKVNFRFNRNTTVISSAAHSNTASFGMVDSWAYDPPQAEAHGASHMSWAGYPCFSPKPQ